MNRYAWFFLDENQRTREKMRLEVSNLDGECDEMPECKLVEAAMVVEKGSSNVEAVEVNNVEGESSGRSFQQK